MNPKCRIQLDAARVAAGGKPLTDAQAANIESRLSATMRALAAKDPNWQGYPADQRLLLAAQQAAADIAGEAARKLANAQRQALKTAETEVRIQTAQQRQPDWSRSRTLVEDMERGRVEIDGIKRDYSRQLMDLIEAADSKQGASVGRQALMVLFDAQNPLMTRDLALEVFALGKAGTGNAAAKAGAEAWLKVSEAMRQRFNAAGGDVGRIDYGYLPQAHDQLRVLAKGQDAWAQEVLPLMDRKRYVREDGSRMNDAEVLDLLRSAWETISTDGANKSEPGAFKGSGARANRGSEHRQLHFKDGQAYLDYQRAFGTGSMYDAMIAHVGGMARDIGLVERYGPNPEAQMRVQFDLASRTDGARNFGGQVAEEFAGPAAQWRVLSGASGSADSRRATVAGVMQHARNIETFGKLQGAVLSSITDLGTYVVTTGYNRLPYFEAVANIGRAATQEARDFMNSHGFIAESLISDLNRWSGENAAQTWSGRIASATMRLSLMNAWTDTLRRGFQMTMAAGVGRLTRVIEQEVKVGGEVVGERKTRPRRWDELNEWDRYRLEAKGLTADDWAVIVQAEPEQFRGMSFVTPDAIYATGDPRASAVVAKYIGMIVDESEIAVLNPDLTTRAIATAGGKQAGTAEGELARAVAQFKSFPIAMISRHWRRMLDTPAGLEGGPMTGGMTAAIVGDKYANRLAYGGALMVSLTALGAIAFQSKQIVSGKDPVDMTTPKFWTRAFAQGGGLGFVGDLLLTDTSDDKSPLDTFGRAFLGPTFGSAADLYELTKGNIDEAMAGKQTHLGAEAVRFARGHAPLVNLWYAKTALDNAGLHALQESLSPGYMARLKNKQRKDWRGEYWWQPGGDLAPERAPSFEQIAGGAR